MRKFIKRNFVALVLACTLVFEPYCVLASETGMQTGEMTESETVNEPEAAEEELSDAKPEMTEETDVPEVTEEAGGIEESEVEEDGEEAVNSCKESVEEKIQQVTEVWNEPHIRVADIRLTDLGTRIEAEAVYESNDQNVQFRWVQYNLQTQKWTVLKEWQESSQITWYPPEKGDYWICVAVKLSDGRTTSKTVAYRYKGVYANLTDMCVVDKGNHFELGVSYETNDPDIVFRWRYYDVAEDEWRLIRDWDAGNWASWKAVHPGDFLMYAEAKLSDGTVVAKSCGHRVKKTGIASFYTNIQSPGWLESEIKLQGKYNDSFDVVGSERYLVYDGNTWRTIPHTSDGAMWSPQSLGKYLFCYEIYNKNGGLIEQSFIEFSVEAPYVNFGNIKINNAADLEYILSVDVDTNDSAAEYRWMYYNVSEGQWHTISDWSKTSDSYWYAPDTGNYWLHVEARLHDGTVQSNTVSYTAQQYPPDLAAMMLYANMYSSSTPYIIMVNRDACKVGIFQGWQGGWSPVMYMDCTVGKPSTPTVSGVFRVGSRGYYFDSYGSRCFWWTQFYGNYLFHSVLYYPNGSLMDGRVGMALSHGCVRLQIDNAKWIYDNIPSGTTVVVY